MFAGREWHAAPPTPAARPWLGLAVLAGALAVAALTALTLSRQPPPYGLELGIGLAFLGVVALAIVRIEAAAFLGLALLGVVVVDPAPADFVLLVVIAVDARHRPLPGERSSGSARGARRIPRREPSVGRRGRRPPGRGSLSRHQHLPDDRRTLAERLRRLATTRADRRGGIPDRRRDVGCGRRRRRPRSRAGQGVPRRRPAGPTRSSRIRTCSGLSSSRSR